MFGKDYQFVHQSTKLSDSGITEVGGQGVRYLMSRRQRSKTEKDISLKDLAQKIATAQSIKLDWQSTFNPLYQHVDQTGISDYALLVRECENVGLMVSEWDSKLIIKSRDTIAKSKMVLSRGKNVISYSVTDTAASSQTTEMAAYLSQTNKSEIDAIGGKMIVQTDADRAKDKAVTGKSTPAVAGTTTADTRGNKARMKRIGGLPSTFTVVLSAESMAVAPLDAVTTEGFGGVLDRIWVVDKITHKVSNNTTTYSVVTPIDVIDSSPATAPPTVGSSVEAKLNTPVADGAWVYPAQGVVTSLFGDYREPGRDHHGADIANVVNTPIYACRAGKVTVVTGNVNGCGRKIQIDHDNGYQSIYMHNESIVATVGQQVATGQFIAYMGGTKGNAGLSTGVHCHFELRRGVVVVQTQSLFPKLGRKGNQIIAREAV